MLHETPLTLFLMIFQVNCNFEASNGYTNGRISFKIINFSFLLSENIVFNDVYLHNLIISSDYKVSIDI